MEKKTHSSIFHRILVGCIAIGMALAGIPARERTNAQSLNTVDRDRGHVMLRALKNEIKKSYYDATFRGIDLEARFKAADEKIDRATSLGQVFGIVAQVLLEF